MCNEMITEAMKVLQDAAECAVKDGFYGTIYGQPYNDGSTGRSGELKNEQTAKKIG